MNDTIHDDQGTFKEYALRQLEDAGPQEAPATDDYQPEPWVLALTPAELEEAQHDGKAGHRFYARWQAQQTAPDRPAEAAANIGVVDPAVTAYEAGALPWSALQRTSQDAVIDRQLDRVLGPRTPVMLAEERGELDEDQVPPADRMAGIRRSFERRGMLARAQRGGRP